MEPQAVEHSEGPAAKALEEQTAKLPLDTFLCLAIGSMVISLTMLLGGKRHVSVFVGQWAPTFLLLGRLQQTGEAAGLGSGVGVRTKSSRVPGRPAPYSF